MDLKEKNIDNLVSLWAKIGRQHGEFSPDFHGFQKSTVLGSQWPNRVWQWPDLDISALDEAVEKIEGVSHILPVFGVNSNIDELLKAKGIMPVFEQVAMFRLLAEDWSASVDIKLERVENSNQAAIWEQVFFDAFGYQVAQRVLLGLDDDTLVFLVKKNDAYVGTAVLHFCDPEVAGIHMLGVSPAARRQGIAEAIMYNLMNLALDRGAKMACLQASTMGLKIYERLGFTRQFELTNYLIQ